MKLYHFHPRGMCSKAVFTFSTSVKEKACFLFSIPIRLFYSPTNGCKVSPEAKFHVCSFDYSKKKS